MCDHYDNYYRMTSEEEKASKEAEKKEAARMAAYHKKREDKLVSDYSERFGVTPEKARREIRRIMFVMEWSY